VERNKILCRRIDSNLRDLAREFGQLRIRNNALENEAGTERDKLREAEVDLAQHLASAGAARAARMSPGTLALRAARMSPGTLALSIVAGITQERETPRIRDRIRRSEAHLGRIESELANNKARVDNIVYLIKESQASYRQYNCFDLGFSHEVLNLP